MSAALVAFLLLLLGSRVVRKRSFTISGCGPHADIGGAWRNDIGGGRAHKGGSRRVDIGDTRRAGIGNARRAETGNTRPANAGGGNDSDSNPKSYDPSLVVDARYEDIE
jgi:hypothetical protein